MFLSCKHVLPTLREQRSGAIVNISSIAAVAAAGMVAYKVSKAGVNALTHAIATSGARYGIRANAIMPGLMHTPMAIEGLLQARDISREELIKSRDAQVPLGGKMGSAWDVAYAALFLASDEARFITGVILPVDGGQSARIVVDQNGFVTPDQLKHETRGRRGKSRIVAPISSLDFRGERLRRPRRQAANLSSGGLSATAPTPLGYGGLHPRGALCPAAVALCVRVRGIAPAAQVSVVVSITTGSGLIGRAPA